MWWVMRVVTVTAVWALLAALCAMRSAQAAALPVVVSADAEAEAANPGRSARRSPPRPARTRSDVHSTLDRVFGEGRWRQTSGYRTASQENALRRAGAGTVPAGRISRHSQGGPQEPGAIDAVVPGMSLKAAAARLRRDGEGVDRVLAEGAHGRQGAHLHIELTDATSEAPPP